MRSLEDIELIVAVDENGGFAKDGEIPWSFKEDWEHFKATTKNTICVMGRKTYEDVMSRKKDPNNGKPALPNRQSYVISRTVTELPGTEGVFPSLRQAVDSIKDQNKRIFILGGEKLYIQSIVWARAVHMTLVPGKYQCNRKFPIDYLQKNFVVGEGKKGVDVNFLRYDRK